MSATPNSSLANPEQLIADLQRQLAECKAERDEALEQQTATAEVLQVINSSPGDLAPVFDAMLEKALRLCGASFGLMNTYDGERLHRVAERGLTPAYNEWRTANPLGSSTAGIPLALQRLIEGELVVHIADLKTHEAYQAGNPNTRALVNLAGARTDLCVALRRGHSVCGTFTIFRQEVRPFSDKQIALLENFASQGVIAMENARLLTETREALEQQTATAEVLQVINSSPGNLAPVFDAMLEKAMRLCEAAFGHLDVYDGQRFETIAVRNSPPAFAEFRSKNPPNYGPGTGPARMLAGERVFQHLDVKDEDAYRHGEPNRRALVDLGGARSVLQVALVKEQTFLGFLTLCRQEVRPFANKQIALLQNFAAQAVIAMENARLLGELRQRTDEVAELNRGLEARVADRRVAPARPRSGVWRWYRPGLRDARSDRVFRALRLYRDRHRVQRRGAPVRRGQGRADTTLPAHRR
jgi:two-component system, NtrC family, sensor kinase